MIFGTGAILLAYLTVQRLAELWWAKQNEARLMALGGIEYAGLWLLAYDRPVEPVFLALFVVLQLARFWVLATLGRRWTIRIVVVPGERLVAGARTGFFAIPIMR